MLREMLKSKIHRATVTEADLRYEGSLSLCPVLRDAADLLLGEKILVVNVDNGARLETYVMKGVPGQVCLNGAAARMGQVGDKIIIMAFASVPDEEARTFAPRLVHVDDANGIVNR